MKPLSLSISCPLLPRGDERLLPGRDITFTEPLAGLDELDDIDDLLPRHDGGTDTGDDPGHGAVHLVGAGHLQRTCAPRVGEQGARFGMRGRARLRRLDAAVVVVDGQQ